MKKRAAAVPLKAGADVVPADIHHSRQQPRRRPTTCSWHLFLALALVVALQLVVRSSLTENGATDDISSNASRGETSVIAGDLFGAGRSKAKLRAGKFNSAAMETLRIVPGRRWEAPDLNVGFVSNNSLPLLAIVSLNAHNNRDDSTNEQAGWMYRMAYNNKKEYCRRWGYDLIIEDDSVVTDRNRDVKWAKILAIRKWLPEYQWVLWMDTDTLLMRFDRPLHDLISNDYDFIGTQDWNGLNSGVFFLRNSPYSLNLLQQIYYTPQIFLKRFSDQAGFQAVLDDRKNKQAITHAEHFLFLPQRDINAYPDEFAIKANKQHTLQVESQYQPGDRIVHFAGCKFKPSCRQTFMKLYNDMLESSGIVDIVEADVESSVRPAINTDIVLGGGFDNESLDKTNPWQQEMGTFVIKPGTVSTKRNMLKSLAKVTQAKSV